MLIALIIFSCASYNGKPKEEGIVLSGKWKIIEQLVDPGDGSGVFNPINSDRTVEFFSNGTVTTNGVIFQQKWVQIVRELIWLLQEVNGMMVK